MFAAGSSRQPLPTSSVDLSQRHADTSSGNTPQDFFGPEKLPRYRTASVTATIGSSRRGSEVPSCHNVNLENDSYTLSPLGPVLSHYQAPSSCDSQGDQRFFGLSRPRSEGSFIGTRLNSQHQKLARRGKAKATALCNIKSEPNNILDASPKSNISTLAPPPSRNEIKVSSSGSATRSYSSYLPTGSSARSRPAHIESPAKVGPKNTEERGAFSKIVAKNVEEHALEKDEKTWNQEMKDWEQRKRGKPLRRRRQKYTPLLKQMMQRIVKSIGFKRAEGSE